MKQCDFYCEEKWGKKYSNAKKSAKVLKRVKKVWGRMEEGELWSPGQEWIQIFDKLLKHPGGKRRGCKCDICILLRPPPTPSCPMSPRLASPHNAARSRGGEYSGRWCDFCTICVQYVHSVYNLCKFCVHFFYNLFTFCVQFVYILCTICVQFMYKLRTNGEQIKKET